MIATTERRFDWLEGLCGLTGIQECNSDSLRGLHV